MTSIMKIKEVIVLLCEIVFVLAVCGTATADTFEENELKTALAYNFARYTEWPKSVDSNAITFCILDNSDLLKAFSKLIGRRIDQREIIVVDASSRTNLRNCQLLVVGGKNRKRISLALEAVKSSPSLTIGELPDFIERGGIINLYQENGKLQFEINPYEAQRSSLRISARLLQLAKIAGE